MNMRDLPMNDALPETNLHELRDGPPVPPRLAARRFAAGAIRTGHEPEALHTYTDGLGIPLYWLIRCKRIHDGNKWIRPMRVRGMVYDLAEPEFGGGKPLYRLHLAAHPN